MNAARPHIVELSRNYPVSAEQLFSWWSTTRGLLAWSELSRCEIDLRVGGNYRFEFPAPEGNEDVTTGTFLEVEAPRRLIFTWYGNSPSGPTGESLVVLEFADRDNGGELRLRHEFPREESMTECTGGWEYWLDSLGRHLASQPPAR